MKRIFTLLFLIPLTSAIGQIEGTWKLAAEAGALAVGPSLGNLSWFQSTAADINTRACLFDDEYVFNADGTFQNILIFIAQHYGFSSFGRISKTYSI